jgi:TonB family protein
MKRFILPLIALTFLVGACSSPTKSTHKPGKPPVLTGKLATAWGELPTYNTSGYGFVLTRQPLLPAGPLKGKTVDVDVMVNADGSVEDATVRTSSGDARIDHAVLASFIGARYSLKVGPGNPAPYVVPLTLKISKPTYTSISSDGIAWNNFKMGSAPPAGAPYYQEWSGAGGSYTYSTSSSSSSK